jgi:dolichyl-phosphate-mannose-protein mannosyltransferase
MTVVSPKLKTRSLLAQPYIGLGLILLGGLLLRLWAMRWPPFPIDMIDWIAWGERVLAVGPWNFYDPDVFADYAPGYVYVMGLTAAIKNGLFPDAGVGTYHFLYRLPPVLCDLVTAAVIFNLVVWAGRERQATDDARYGLALLAAASHAFSPAIIFNSAIWGQIDATFTLGMLLALVFALRDRPVAAVISYVIAFLIKPQAISLAPVLGLVLLMRYPWRRWLRAGLAGIAVAYVMCLPFLGINALGGLIALLSRSVETYPYATMFTFNIWSFSAFEYWEKDDLLVIGNLTRRTFGTVLYFVGIVGGAALLWQRLRRTRDDAPTMLLFASLFTMLPVMVLTRMHERYLYPVLPLLLAYAFVQLARDPQSLRGLIGFCCFAVLTLLHTLNLYYVYTFYQYYDEGVPDSNRWFPLIGDNARLWTVLTLLAFATLIALAAWPRRTAPQDDTGKGSV